MLRRQVAGRVQQEPGQLDPARGPVERPVERELRRRDRLGVVAASTACGTSSASRSSSSISSSVMRSAAERASLAGDRGLQPEDVLDVAAGERRHHVAAVRLELHHALAAQRPQRLADRRDADPELGGGLVEPDEGARPQGAGHDAGPQVRGDLVGQLFAPDRADAIAGRDLHGCAHGAPFPVDVLSVVVGVVPEPPRP